MNGNANRPLLDVVRRTPRLCHLTRQDSLKPLLQSKGLLARPAWDFADTEEYRHGIRLQRDFFARVKSDEPTRTLMQGLLTDAYGKLQPDLGAVLEKVLENLTYELDHPQDPRVKVYVACFTTRPTVEMIRSYGECLIFFNFILPLLAYHAPSPFTHSMLSRVTYDENEFLNFSPSMAFSVENWATNERRRQMLGPESEARRVEMVADWASENLCLFAPNIKRPEFQFESEWRLKSCISQYPVDPSLPPSERRAQLVAMGLPGSATFVPIGTGPERYLHVLTFMGHFISQEIAILSDDGAELSRWVEEWQKTESMPLVDLDDFFGAVQRMEGGLFNPTP